QINTIEKLGSDRNARKVLFELEEDKLIKSVRRNKKIYFVTNKGNDLIGKGNTRLKRSEIDHSLMRNDLYIKLGMPDSWKKESRIIINRSEEHTSELQSRFDLVCRLLLEKKNKTE